MENASKALIIAGAILISILIISLGVLVYNNASSTVSRANLNSQEAKAHNSSFEGYFGTDVTATEAKNLLSEVRTNNLTSSRNEESAVIGVCYISKDANEVADGIYADSTNPKNVNNDIFKDLLFSADVQNITNQLRAGTSYTINVPNTKAFKDDQQGLTGFEVNKETGTIETPVSGDSGGYYSSGYIRLIYIIDNTNRAEGAGASNSTP
jgi:hypothetical protein